MFFRRADCSIVQPLLLLGARTTRGPGGPGVAVSTRREYGLSLACRPAPRPGGRDRGRVADVDLSRPRGAEADDRGLYEAEKPVAVYCRGVSALVDVQLSDGSYLVKGKTVTGFSNAEEDYSDAFVGQKMMPWRIEDALRERGATYVQGGLLKAFAVRDGRLITGQQQYSSRKSRRHSHRNARRLIRSAKGRRALSDRGAVDDGRRRLPEVEEPVEDVTQLVD
jgi:hypothetical protein